MMMSPAFPIQNSELRIQNLSSFLRDATMCVEKVYSDCAVESFCFDAANDGDKETHQFINVFIQTVKHYVVEIIAFVQ